jgi:hypothetical protein
MAFYEFKIHFLIESHSRFIGGRMKHTDQQEKIQQIRNLPNSTSQRFHYHLCVTLQISHRCI